MSKKGKDWEDWWDLRASFLELTIPALKKMIKEGHSCPEGMTEKDWNKILSKMIIGFEKAQAVVNTKILSDENVINESFDLFKKHFFDLWD